MKYIEECIKDAIQKKIKSFKNYGGRGIAICDEWLHNKAAFFEWALSNGYSDDLTIDRIDPNKNYEPNNCRWASWKTQANNKRNNTILEIDGEKHTLSEWSDISGNKVDTISKRINKYGWTVKDAVFLPSRRIHGT